MTHQGGAHPRTRAPRRRPPLPKWIFKVLNPLFIALLRSRWHSRMSGRLMLLTYAGRRTGRQYTTPIGYHELAPGELLSFSFSRWWRYLRGGAPVRLLLRGRSVRATPTVIEDRDEVVRALEELIRRRGLEAARRLPIGLPRDREPTTDDLRVATRDLVFVRFRLDEGT